MSEDLTVEIARARRLLRTAVATGRATPEASQALGRLQTVAQQSRDQSLLYECRRWRVHLAHLSL